MKQVKQVHLLPTDKASILYMHTGGELDCTTTFSIVKEKNNQHIYFTDNFKIKEGKLSYDVVNNCFKIFERGDFPNSYMNIVSSTDKEITPNSWIPESFVKKYIEMYNAGTPITEVNVEMWDNQTVNEKYSWYDPKTREDGSIIISLIESRTYTREEIKSIFKKVLLSKIKSENLLGLSLHNDDLDQLIEEHL